MLKKTQFRKTEEKYDAIALWTRPASSQVFDNFPPAAAAEKNEGMRTSCILHRKGAAALALGTQLRTKFQAPHRRISRSTRSSRW